MQEELSVIKACQQGNHKEFGRLYDIYIRRIYDFIYYKTFHKETAEDLASKTFLKALENVSRFNPEIGSFSSWVYRIARNTVIDHYRTKKTHADIEDFWDLSEKEDLDAALDKKEMVAKLRAHLSKLSSSQRDVIIMRVWQEMSYAEIAAITGQSEAGCRMMFSRAVNRLKIEMPLLLFITLMCKII